MVVSMVVMTMTSHSITQIIVSVKPAITITNVTPKRIIIPVSTSVNTTIWSNTHIHEYVSSLKNNIKEQSAMIVEPFGMYQIIVPVMIINCPIHF